MEELKVIPIYQRIRIQLYKDISSGVFKVGDTIPTEESLMKRFRASRTTIRRAVSSLVKEGIVVRKAGKGSFVNRNFPKTRIRMRGSFNDILDVAKSTSVKVLRFEYIEPPPEVTKQLQVKKDERVLCIDRVRFAKETPFLYSVNYLPKEVGRFLSIHDLEEKPLTQLLTEKCRQVLKNAVQNFGATVADDRIAAILKIPMGFPLLTINRIATSSEDRLINLFLGHFRSDLYVFTTVFSYDESR
jgi:GntR family transcriptional regulator